MSTNAHNPTPMEMDPPEKFAFSTLGNQGYNLNFEPNASKYDNKLVIDKEADLIGVTPRRRSATELNKRTVLPPEVDENLDAKFEFQGKA